MKHPQALLKTLLESSIGERIVYTLVFLFPIAGMSVRHWLSGIFGLIAIISILLLLKTTKEPLHREEKILLYVFLAFLLSFALSATLNDWTINSIKRIGTEFKYLLFIPVYLLIRRNTQVAKFLFAGVLLGCIVLGIQAIYDTYFHEWHRAVGQYGQIAFGDIAILYFSITGFIAIQYRESKYSRYLIAPLAMSLLSIYLSGTRNAWLAFLVSIVLIFFLSRSYLNIKQLSKVFMPAFMLAIFIAIVVSLTSQSQILTRLTTAISEVDQISSGQEIDNTSTLHGKSFQFRLEKWKVALSIFTEAPVFGYGAGNVGIHINRYVKAGKAHPDLYDLPSETGIGDTWSAYIDSLVNEGTVGFIVFMIFLLYPLYISIKLHSRNAQLSNIGIVFTVSYMIFGLSEDPFISDNASSVYLLFLAVIFSSLVTTRYRAGLKCKQRSDKT
jgi:O-antigen ligase